MPASAALFLSLPTANSVHQKNSFRNPERNSHSRSLNSTTYFRATKSVASCSRAQLSSLPGPREIQQRPGSAIYTAAQSYSRGSSLTLRGLPSNGSRTSADWVNNVASVECDVPLPLAWSLWDDMQRIPIWMKWIKSVQVIEENPRKVSEWTLSTEQLGQSFNFSWTATSLTPTKYEKIHWMAEKGLKNKGAIRFFKGKDFESCRVEMSISYLLPSPLAPLGDAVKPLVESILDEDMQKFKEYAAEQYRISKAAKKK